MWICKTCGYKNGNSNKTCHGVNCKETKPIEIIKREEIKHARKNIKDYCPSCHTWRMFKHLKGKTWKCTVCHKACRMIGKPIPEPKRELKKTDRNSATIPANIET